MIYDCLCQRCGIDCRLRGFLFFDSGKQTMPAPHWAQAHSISKKYHPKYTAAYDQFFLLVFVFAAIAIAIDFETTPLIFSRCNKIFVSLSSPIIGPSGLLKKS